MIWHWKGRKKKERERRNLNETNWCSEKLMTMIKE